MLEIDCLKTARAEADRDRFMDVWRQAEADCGHALTAWRQASKPSERAAAFALYRAALEHEEQAADALALLLSSKPIDP
jgi:hypothetical protein